MFYPNFFIFYSWSSKPNIFLNILILFFWLIGGQGLSGRFIVNRGHSRGDDMLRCYKTLQCCIDVRKSCTAAIFIKLWNNEWTVHSLCLVQQTPSTSIKGAKSWSGIHDESAQPWIYQGTIWLNNNSRSTKLRFLWEWPVLPLGCNMIHVPYVFCS